MKYFLIIFLSISCLFIFGSVAKAQSAQNITQVNLLVTGCNFDNQCNNATENIYNCPSDCSPTNIGTTGSIPNNIYNFTVTSDYNKVIINWISSVPTFSNLSWGTTSKINEGVIKNVALTTNHQSVITGLKSDTTYFILIESIDYYGRTTTYNASFKTLTPISLPQPQNPLHFTATTTSKGIELSWQNPTDKNFSYVRIMRNNNNFSFDPFNGTLIYEGGGTDFLDKQVESKFNYYYSIFNRQVDGSFSSGAGATAFYQLGQNPNIFEFPPILSPQPSIKYFVVRPDQDLLPITGNDVFINNDQKIEVEVSVDDDFGRPIIILTDTEGYQDIFFTTHDSTRGIYRITTPFLNKNGYYKIQILANKGDKTIELGKLNLQVKGGVTIEAEPRISFLNFLILLLGIILFWILVRLERIFFFED